MWSLFSRDPTTSFPYEIGEPVQPPDERSIFTLHHAKKKACGSPVSAFVCLGAVHNNVELELARAAVRRLKILKHPCILTYVDSLESDKAVYLITTRVSPLLSWLLDCNLSPQHRNSVAAWGLRQVLHGLSFLNGDGKLEHLNICSSSVFVTPGGEWKIAGVEYCRAIREGGPSPEPPPNKLPPSLNVYDAPEKTNLSLCKSMTHWSSDTWGAGCLMWEVFTGAPLMQSGALRNTSKFPPSVVPIFRTMLAENPGQRPHARDVVAALSKPGAFLDNDLVRTICFLDDIHVKQDQEKQRFFSSLPAMLDNIPPFITKNKILPATLAAHQFSNVGSVVLAPLFKMSKLLTEVEYQSQVLPSVVRLFSSSDRATRLHLLQQMETLITHMDATTVNEKVFGELATGFLDTNPTIREHTVKSVLYLAPKLNKHNLNVEVLKHFARLQAKDEQGGIRTNCTVCLGKVAPQLAPVTRQKCLISAFTRALRDPFPPARIAGVMALAATQHYYPLDQVAQRILPALCQLTLDPEKSVRDAVFRVLKGFMGKLEKLSEDPSLREEMEAEISAASSSEGGAGGAGGWAGWAVGTLTSKFYKSSISSGPATAQPARGGGGAGGADKQKNDSAAVKAPQSPSGSTQPTSSSSSSKPHLSHSHSTSSSSGGRPHLSHSSSSSSGPSTAVQSFSSSVDSFMAAGDSQAGGGGDGWGDDDDDDWKPIEEEEEEQQTAAGGGWEDGGEDWGELDQQVSEELPAALVPAAAAAVVRGSSSGSSSQRSSARSSVTSSSAALADFTASSGPLDQGARAGTTSTKSAAAYSWSAAKATAGNPDSDDFFSSIAATDRASAAAPPAVGGGDDWGSSWEGDQDTAVSGRSAPDSREEREERKQRRLQQIEARRAARGPMKLGTKKT